MKIQYKRTQGRFNLFFGIIWMINFIVELYFFDKPMWIDYSWLLFSLAYFGIYFYQKKYEYVRIENDVLIVEGPFGKKLNLNEISRIKKFAGDYIIKTDKKEVAINTKIIDPDSLSELNAAFENYNVEWN